MDKNITRIVLRFRNRYNIKKYNIEYHYEFEKQECSRLCLLTRNGYYINYRNLNSKQNFIFNFKRNRYDYGQLPKNYF